MRINILLAHLFLIYSQFSVHADESIIVHTTYGDILGYQTDMARVFYGIPFAQPPVGDLRLKIV